jgi:hypothetical protein
MVRLPTFVVIEPKSPKFGLSRFDRLGAMGADYVCGGKVVKDEPDEPPSSSSQGLTYEIPIEPLQLRKDFCSAAPYAWGSHPHLWFGSSRRSVKCFHNPLTDA